MRKSTPLDGTSPGSAFCTHCGAKVEQGRAMAGPVRAARSRPLGLVVVIILTALNGLVILGITLLLGSTMGLAGAIATGAMGLGMSGERLPFWVPLLLRGTLGKCGNWRGGVPSW